MRSRWCCCRRRADAVYAQSIIAVEDRRSALGAVLGATRLLRRNPPIVLSLLLRCVWARPAARLSLRRRRRLGAAAITLAHSAVVSFLSSRFLRQASCCSVPSVSRYIAAPPPSSGGFPAAEAKPTGPESAPCSRAFRNAPSLVDDEAANVEVLIRTLTRAGFTRVESTTDSREVASLYIQHRPDLILLDLHMPHLDGLDVMDQLNEIAEASYLPILILSGDLTPEARREALSRGAKDFVNKPFQADELLLRIKTLLETRILYIQIQSQNQLLEAKVRERTRELVEAQIEIIERSPSPRFRDKTRAHKRVEDRCRRCSRASSGCPTRRCR